LGGKRIEKMREDDETKNLTVKEEENTEVALSPQEEAKALLDEASKGAVSALLKFKQDHFHIRGEAVPLGTKFYAYPGNWERQWNRFDDGKHTDQIRVQVKTKKPLPPRNKLSDPHLADTDKDPWSLANVIPLENVETGQVVLFTTQSVGGRIAIDEMVMAYSKAVLAGTARGLPIIELRIGTFASSYNKDVPRPDFPIVDWEHADATPAAPTIIPPEPKKQPKQSPKDFASADDFDDEIPF
jgi:hypothetical protein